MFDTNGNVLHCVVKTASKERVDRFLAYVKFLVKDGAFGDGISFDLRDGRVKTTRVPVKRHAKRNR